MDTENVKSNPEIIENNKDHNHDQNQNQEKGKEEQSSQPASSQDDHHNQQDHEKVSTPKHHTNVDDGGAPPPSSVVTSPVEGEPDVSNDENKSKSEADPPKEEEEPSPMPPDLSQVTEEIDNYIATLSYAKDNKSDVHPEVPICVEQFAVLVEAMIEEYESKEVPMRLSQLKMEESTPFLDIVCRICKLSTLFQDFSRDYIYAYTINRIGGVLHHAMSCLEEDFRFLLEDRNKLEVSPPDDSSSSSAAAAESKDQLSCPIPTNQDAPPDAAEISDPSKDNITFPGYSEDNVVNLHRLAEILIDGGYVTECCQVYYVARRKDLEETLEKTGFLKHSIDDIQKMQWEPLTREIEIWITAMKQCSSILFPNERKLADSVFPNHQSFAITIFNSLSRGILMELLNFSEAVTMSKRSAEKLFKFLDLYEALRDIIPSFDSVFDRKCSDEIKKEASLIRSRLGESMITIFSELENSIKADTGKNSVPGGAVHPLTRYIMNYFPLACEYRGTLDQVFREHQNIERSDSGTGSEFDINAQPQGDQNPDAPKPINSPFRIQLVKVMDLLDSHLEAKAKLYKDGPLSSIFLMNNGRYILQKIRGSPETNTLMGDPWFRKRSSDLRQYHKNYQRETWGKPLNCLMNHEGLNVNGKVVKPVLKERFKNFNAMFDEIHRTQSTWVVCDEQLQSELRVSVSNMVIPAYRAFLARYGQTLTAGRQTEKYVKLQPEDIETYIDELFDGNATLTGKKKP